ncbi:unnamed protein product [Owenia fusiformis]|uniref:Uncharacterized protein n=1 Tax=Owenia fusiformis TaxID=6347 RepID=A0A8J1UTL6_OWEFU|nr:unnamed protein product [Owenia fusiformis]
MTMSFNPPKVSNALPGISERHQQDHGVVLMNNFINEDKDNGQPGYLNRNKDNSNLPDIKRVVYDRGTLKSKPPDVKRRGMFGGPSEMANRRSSPEKRNHMQGRSTSRGYKYDRNIRNNRKSLDCNSDDNLFERQSCTEVMESPLESPWGQFENHVKNIDDDTQYYTKPRKITFRSSTDYSTLVDELRKIERKKAERKQMLASVKKEAVVVTHGMDGVIEQNRNIEEEAEREVAQQERLEEERKRLRAKRYWNKIRMHVQEKIMKKKSKTIGWGVISHTIKKMSDGERTREDLYERYLKHHNPMFNRGEPPDSFVQRVRIMSATSRKESSLDRHGRKPRSKSASASLSRPGSSVSTLSRPRTVHGSDKDNEDVFPRWM